MVNGISEEGVRGLFEASIPALAWETWVRLAGSMAKIRAGNLWNTILELSAAPTDWQLIVIMMQLRTTWDYVALKYTLAKRGVALGLGSNSMY
jgi:hypothetical protein